MPGWDSLQSVGALHGGFQIAGLILLALLVPCSGVIAWQLRKGVWPQWVDIGEFQIRRLILEAGFAVLLTGLLACELAGYAYGARQQALMAEAERESADRISRLTALSKARPVAETPSRYVKENSDLQQKLSETENKLAALERTQSQKHLSAEQQRYLIEALRPFAGQKVSIASIRGDDDGQMLARQFVSVFEAAGWDHHGEAGVTTQDWPRDPVGIEVTLNETDARANDIAAGIIALINVVRQLGLVYDNTVYMDEEVPRGQALLKVGKKLRN